MKPYSYIRGALRQYDIDQQYIAEQLGEVAPMFRSDLADTAHLR